MHRFIYTNNKDSILAVRKKEEHLRSGYKAIRKSTFEADLVSDVVPELAVDLVGDALGHAHGLSCCMFGAYFLYS